MDDPQQPLPSIPIPPAQRWREVRLLYLPRVVFFLGVGVAALMWNRWITPATLVAEAEVVQADVRSTQAGVLAGLKVAMFQPVQASELLGQLVFTDPKILDATLAVIRAEVGMLSATLAGATDRQRIALEFERLQLDWMSARVELASMRGRLLLAEDELNRAAPLHRTGVLSEEDFARLRTSRDSLVEQVAEQTQMVKRLEPVFSAAAAAGASAVLSTDAALAASIKVADAKLKLAEQQLMPAPLVAPISGVVTLVLRRNGETVVAGEPILRITASRPEKLTSFLRQPLPFEPKVGAPVELRSRSGTRVAVSSKVLQVGTAMETITPSLVSAMRLPPTPLPEPGLRVQFAIPDGFAVKPGEFVDVLVP